MARLETLPTRIDVVFTKSSTDEARNQALAVARANGSIEHKPMFPDAADDPELGRLYVVKVPDAAVQQRVISALREVAAVEAADPTPTRWLTSPDSGHSGLE